MKVNTKIPEYIYDIISSDSEYFDIKIGSISNRLIKYYMNKEFKNKDFNYKGDKSIQFNLDKHNEAIFIDCLKKNEIKSNSDYLRLIYFEYINNLKTIREKILFSDIFNKLESYILNSEKVIIDYKNKLRKVDPYFIISYEKEGRSYLFCYCDESKDYRSYKISDIKDIYNFNEKYEIKDKEYVGEIKKNFDPFLSFKNEVKVRLTEKGKEIYKVANINKPELLRIEEGIHVFQCNIPLALIYFAQFYNEVKILEPKELRDKIKEKTMEMLELYK